MSLRFRLRTFLIWATLICLGGVFVFEFRNACENVQQLELLGAKLHYSNGKLWLLGEWTPPFIRNSVRRIVGVDIDSDIGDIRINSLVLYSDPPVPQWVLNYMGIDHFCCVREVWIAEEAEIDVEFLGGLQGVELLTLHEDLPQPKLQRVRELFPNTRIEPFDSNNDDDEP